MVTKSTKTPKKSTPKKAEPKKAVAKKAAPEKAAPKTPKKAPRGPRRATISDGPPLTLEQAQAVVRSTQAPRRGTRRALVVDATPASVGKEREQLEKQQREERERRVEEYKATMELLKKRGVKGLGPPETEKRRAATPGGGGRRRAPGVTDPNAGKPLQIFAEGDSWFDYPVPLFGGGIVLRLQKKLGVPVLNLAKAGDEARFMLGVKERQIIVQQLTNGCPAGGPWDAMLFSGGGNDIVDNPMALWITDFDPNIPVVNHIHPARFAAALDLVRFAYEDLIGLRDQLSPTTHLIFHAYDFAIPDGRGVCFMGPWLQPTFKLRKFPTQAAGFNVVKAMLQKFAAMLTALEGAHPNVTFINGQGTLAPVTTSWHNELHPTKTGFQTFADLFHAKLKAMFPGRVL